MYYEFQTLPNGCKSAFLNNFIKETVYVEQPPRFGQEKFLIMFSNLRRLYMTLNKHLMHDMIESKVFF